MARYLRAVLRPLIVGSVGAVALPARCACRVRQPLVVRCRGAGGTIGRPRRLGSAADPALDPAVVSDPRPHAVPRWRFIRPEIRQYFVESNTEGTPFDRETRDMVYERAKGHQGRRAVRHRARRQRTRLRVPAALAARASSPPIPHPRVRLGGPDCTQPYDIALLNVSAMSFGSLSANAILALNGGAARGGFAHDTGEGGISPYHLRARRRSDLGDRLRLFRLPRRRRQLRRRRNSPRRRSFPR